MQSAGVVLWLVAACASCHPNQTPPRPGPPNSTPSRPRATLLALVRAAAALHHHPRVPAHYHVTTGAQPSSAPSVDTQDATPEIRAWGKRAEVPPAPLSSQQDAGAGIGQGPPIASTFLRHARSGPRPYDVPRIDCPAAEDQMERFPCPSPDRMGRYRCIDDHVLCDGFIDCPDGEDEDRRQCMFYKTTKAHLDVLADAIIRWARGGK